MSIVLTQEYTKQQMARAVPGARYSDTEKAWVLDSITPRSATIALKLFPHLTSIPEMTEARDAALSDVRPFDTATPWVSETATKLVAQRVRARVADQWSCPKCSYHVDLAAGPVVWSEDTDREQDPCRVCPIDGEPLVRWTLNGYQEVDLAYGQAVLDQHGAFYMGWERGLGKTLGTCLLIDAMDTATNLVVCPNSAKEAVWGDELTRFCPWLEVIILGNSKAKRDHALQRAQFLQGRNVPFALVVHYEALAVIAGKTKNEKNGRTTIGDGWAKLAITWDLMVTDEDHRLSNTDSQMYRAARKVPKAKLLILSGSIIQHALEELYSPHARAFPDRYRSKWRDWNDRFLDYIENGYGKICVGVQSGAIEPLRKELGVWMVYRRKEDELDLPPKRYVERRIPLNPKQRKVYDQLRDECLAQVGTSMVVAEEGIGMMGRLRQVATGLELVTGEVADSSKLDAAVEDIMDMDEDSAVVIFSWYRAAVYALQDRLTARGVASFAVTGNTPQAERAEMIKRFQAGEGKAFIGTLSTLGESVNLQRANYVIRLDRSFNPMTNVQAEDRVFRQGQRRNVTVTDYIAKDTVDELQVMPILANKAALRAAILGGGR